MKRILFFLLLTIIGQSINSQNVGIGTTTPNLSSQLDVTSTTKGLLIPRMTSAQRTAIATPAAGLMVYETTTNSFWFYNGSAWSQIGTGGISPWTTLSNNIYNTNSGRVGIGTTAPVASAELEISSTNTGLLIPRMTTLQRQAISSPANGLLVYDTDFKEFYHHNGTAWRTILNSLIWTPSPTRKWVYNFSDSIGIGTSTPDARLEVIGNVKTSARIDAGGVVEAAGLSTTAGGSLFVSGTSLLQGAVTGSSSAAFASTITSNTSMLINDPAAILTLQSSSVDKAFMQLSGDDMRIGTFSSNNAGRFMVRVNGVNTLNITPAYNVGIGTETPSSKLHVVGRIFANASGEAIKIDGSNPNIGFYQNGVYHGFISQSGTELFIGVNGGNLHLDGQQVAIGTVVPAASAYKLTVSGKIICEEVKVKLVSSGWPDYVFDNKYKLPSLPEVEKFILQNKHLPDMPCAAEVEKNGIEVGDMQKRMMEKIEELTLYVIELQKQVDELKKKQ